MGLSIHIVIQSLPPSPKLFSSCKIETLYSIKQLTSPPPSPPFPQLLATTVLICLCECDYSRYLIYISGIIYTIWLTSLSITVNLHLYEGEDENLKQALGKNKIKEARAIGAKLPAVSGLWQPVTPDPLHPDLAMPLSLQCSKRAFRICMHLTQAETKDISWETRLVTTQVEFQIKSTWFQTHTHKGPQLKSWSSHRSTQPRLRQVSNCALMILEKQLFPSLKHKV